MMHKAFVVTVVLLALSGRCWSMHQAFDCNKASSRVGKLICTNAELGALDQKMSSVYAQAQEKESDGRLSNLETEQRAWIMRRYACEKATCVSRVYRERIADLQAQYRLVMANGPFFFLCLSKPAGELKVSFFETDPPTMIAELVKQTVLMRLQPSASGTRYQGKSASYWEHHDEAMVIWGLGASEQRCVPRTEK